MRPLLAVSAPFWFDMFVYGRKVSYGEIIQARYYSILLGFLAFLFLTVFRLIFDSLPIQALREHHRARRQLRLVEGVSRTSVAETTEHVKSEEPVEAKLPTGTADMVEHGAAPPSPEALLTVLSQESKYLSERTYTRAGVYLLVGVLIALTGLVFFYLQSISLPATDVAGLLATLAPRVGILFFIEFVAIFFLRQYWASMDEFRYFEAVRRNREENLALILLTTKKWSDIDIYKAIQACAFNTHVGRILTGETTELLETRKLTKDELAVFERIVDAMAKPKA